MGWDECQHGLQCGRRQMSKAYDRLFELREIQVLVVREYGYRICPFPHDLLVHLYINRYGQNNGA